MLPIADRWFDTKRISDDITLLWEPHVPPLMCCNIWHVRGRDRDLMIDTGIGIVSRTREKATGALSGDAIYDGPLLDKIDGGAIPTYVRTMKRVRESPVQMVHAGHDPSFGGARLVEFCDAYLARRA